MSPKKLSAFDFRALMYYFTTYNWVQTIVVSLIYVIRHILFSSEAQNWKVNDVMIFDASPKVGYSLDGLGDTSSVAPD